MLVMMLALFIGALPQGWMPKAGPQGIVFTLCSGKTVIVDHLAGEHGPADTSDTGSQICAYALIADEDMMPLPGRVRLAPHVLQQEQTAALHAAIISGGLATAPPPARGPPIHA